jgi:hypothetical protein
MLDRGFLGQRYSRPPTFTTVLTTTLQWSLTIYCDDL